MSVEISIRDFIVDELGWPGPRDELTDGRPLIDDRVLDSVGIFQTVAFLESEFGIEVHDDELVPRNFETIGALAELVRSKLG